MGWRDRLPIARSGQRRRLAQRRFPQVIRDFEDSTRIPNLIPDAGSGWANPKYLEYYATSTPAYAAVKLRSDSLAAAPLVAMMQNEAGELAPVNSSHPVQEIFDRVNGRMTTSDLIRITEIQLCLHGQVYWFIDPDGETGTEIWPVRADYVQPIPKRKQRNRVTMPNADVAGYWYTRNGQRTALLPEELIPITYANPMDDYAGLSPIASHRQAADMGRDAVTFNREFFSKGVNPGNFAFITEATYSDAEVDDFHRRIDERYRGAKNAHRPFLIHGGGVDAKNLGFSQRDMEFLASLQYTVQDAARVWRVWPELLASGTTAAFRNVPEAAADFWLSTVSNEWEFVESEITELLLPALGAQAQGLVAVFDTTQVAALQKARNEENRKDLEAVKQGTLTINEWREQQGMDPVEWGDVWWRSSSLTATENAEMPDPEPLEPLPPLNDGEEEPPDDDDDSNSAAYALRTVRAARNSGRIVPRVQKGGMLPYEKAVKFFLKALNNREREFRTLQRNLFTQQQDDVMETLLKADDLATIPAIIDPTMYREKWAARAESYYIKGVQTGANQTARLWNLRPKAAVLATEKAGVFNPFDVNDPGFKAWIFQRTAFWADRTNEQTAKLINDEIVEALANGEDLPAIMARVERVFEFSSAVRAERIARTEMVAAQNTGSITIMRSSGEVQYKRWLTSNDELVRETHSDTQNRGAIPLDEPFEVGTDSMDTPGTGSVAGENINCRCIVQPVLTP